MVLLKEGWEIKEIPFDPLTQLLSCASREPESCRTTKCQISLSLSALERLVEPPNRGQLPGWKRKSSNHFPSHGDSSWSRAGFHQGKNIGEKAKGDWQLLLFRDCLSLPHLLPHLHPAWTWAVLEGSRIPCPLLGQVLHSRDALAPGEGQEGSSTLCLLTHRAYRTSNRNLCTTATGIYPPQQREIIPHGKMLRNTTSRVGKCTQTTSCAPCSTLAAPSLWSGSSK